MKKAVIASGGKQYIVSEGDVVDVELIKDAAKKLSFEPLLVIDGDKTVIGRPVVAGITVSAEVVAAEIKQQKVVAIRFKAKKRVHKTRGHRQRKTQLKITKIA